MPAFYELRQYRIRDGQRARWVAFMEEKVIPFQTARGMTIVGSWTDPAQPDHYVWMRRFESEEQRKALFSRVYEDPAWAAEFRPAIGEMLDRDRIVVTHLEATPNSAMR